MQSEILNITADGIVDKREALFQIRQSREGKYRLSRVIGRPAGTRPNSAENNVWVDSLEEVVEHMLLERDGKPMYYVWLTYAHAGVNRRHQFSPKNVTIHWKE